MNLRPCGGTQKRSWPTRQGGERRSPWSRVGARSKAAVENRLHGATRATVAREKPAGWIGLLQVRRNCASKKSKVQKLGRAGVNRRSTPSAENPSGVDKSLSQALIDVTTP